MVDLEQCWHLSFFEDLIENVRRLLHLLRCIGMTRAMSPLELSRALSLRLKSFSADYWWVRVNVLPKRLYTFAKTKTLEHKPQVRTKPSYFRLTLVGVYVADFFEKDQ